MQKKEKILTAGSYGGFESETNEYHIFGNKKTPMPWVNICANPEFGTLITEGGSMFTWYKNSYLFRITPRIDDPINRNSGEEIYLKDDRENIPWRPTRNATTSHGKGYSRFESQRSSLLVKTTILVSIKSPLKLIKVDIKNNSNETRAISATYYNQLILGEGRKGSSENVVAKYNFKKELIEATNPQSEEFSEDTVFLGANTGSLSYTFDRSEFFGRGGGIDLPEALVNIQLPNKNETANDTCAALSSLVKIPPGKEKTIIFFMSVNNPHKRGAITEALFDSETKALKDFWDETCSKVEIETPNKELDILFNKQLLHQAISSRLWGRTGLYQPGGAFGYRDQLQDVSALCFARPEISKKHILKAASRQFFGGGVQQWWHPPKNRGIRSSSSDAHLWLVHAVCRYIEITGDKTILTEKVPYLLSEKQEHHGVNYYAPKSSIEKYTILEHCQEAIGRTVHLMGEKGLPLILSGDWNDGMDLIGREKRGESVWMAMFLIRILADFTICAKELLRKNDREQYEKLIQKTKESLEENCWDGEWYLRAFWDDGEKLGSKDNDECKIDSLTQSWAVISGLDEERQKKALSQAEKILIDRKSKIVKLFTPPFLNTKRDPGYISLYPPGVRENGGSYNHANGWFAKAAAISGNGDLAMEIIDSMNPLKRTRNNEQVEIYRAEPYAVAADICAEGPYKGIAGWTWYTGSAGVIYTVVMEDILGIKIRGDKVYLAPSVPKSWETFRVSLTLGNHKIEIRFLKKKGGQIKPQKTISDFYQEGVLDISKIKGDNILEIYYE